MNKPNAITLQEALEKVNRCYDMQSNEKNECFEHGLGHGTCAACVHYVSAGTAWMMLAAMGKTSIAAR